MATAAQATTYPHIEKTADVRGGKPCIAGTRIAVVDIVLAHEQGLKPAELVSYFSSRPLELAEIHAAVAYHYDHPEELEQHLRDSERAVQETEAAQADYLRRKSGP
jgi:uncharacterized protein (DUF433 family)